MVSVKVVNQQELIEIDFQKAKEISREIFSDHAISDAKVNLVLMDDASIHVLNKRYLEHDEPTDVITFPLSNPGAKQLLGDIVISAETAKREAIDAQTEPFHELLLYAIHGCLHLCGFDDKTDKERRTMREKEAIYLRKYALKVRHSLDE